MSQANWNLFKNKCPHCGSENRGNIGFCNKCSRRIDYEGDYAELFILKCPKCFKLYKNAVDIRQCDCGYVFYWKKKRGKYSEGLFNDQIDKTREDGLK